MASGIARTDTPASTRNTSVGPIRPVSHAPPNRATMGPVRCIATLTPTRVPACLPFAIRTAPSTLAGPTKGRVANRASDEVGVEVAGIEEDREAEAAVDEHGATAGLVGSEPLGVGAVLGREVGEGIERPGRVALQDGPDEADVVDAGHYFSSRKPPMTIESTPEA